MEQAANWVAPVATTIAAIMVAANLVKNDYNRRVAQEIEQVMNQESFFSASAAQGGSSV